MNLAMPFTPKDLKRRYRELAKRHHPDRNPHKPGVAETMAAINQAAEVLTGVDATKLEQGIGITDQNPVWDERTVRLRLCLRS